MSFDTEPNVFSIIPNPHEASFPLGQKKTALLQTSLSKFPTHPSSLHSAVIADRKSDVKVERFRNHLNIGPLSSQMLKLIKHILLITFKFSHYSVFLQDVFKLCNILTFKRVHGIPSRKKRSEETSKNEYLDDTTHPCSYVKTKKPFMFASLQTTKIEL